jgi:hypothetical protein
MKTQSRWMSVGLMIHQQHPLHSIYTGRCHEAEISDPSEGHSQKMALWEILKRGSQDAFPW